jgi:hypothetical protein
VNHLLLAATKNWHTANGGYNSSAHTPASVWARTDEPERQATAEENQARRMDLESSFPGSFTGKVTAARYCQEDEDQRKSGTGGGSRADTRP